MPKYICWLDDYIEEDGVEIEADDPEDAAQEYAEKLDVKDFEAFPEDNDPQVVMIRDKNNNKWCCQVCFEYYKSFKTCDLNQIIHISGPATT